MAKFNIFNPTTLLDSEFRIRKALEGGQAAAFIVAGIHALGGLLFLGTGKAVAVWLPHLALALLAGLLGALMRSRPWPWLAGLILAWPIVEIPFTRPTMFVPLAFTILLAYQGLRGALARKKLNMSADAF